jgi:hypothetical protein
MPAARLARSVALMAAVVGLATVTACTSATSGKPTSTSAPSTESAPATAEPTDSGDTSPTDSAPVTSPVTTSVSPTASKPATGTGCALAQLSVRLIRGGAIAGQEIALITFTNTDSKACTMFGFPGVSLRLNNALLGQPATRTSKTPATVTLKPGEQAEALLRDYTTCQAALSDTVRVYPPDSTQFVDKPFELRGCQTQIDPVSHS